MQPEAARLASRIRTVLKGESGGQETAILAWQYAEAVKKANERLESALRKIEADNLLAGYLEERHTPNLLNTCDDLNFSELPNWQALCQENACTVAPALNLENLSTLRLRLSKIENEKEWLYGEYRECLRSKKTLQAYPIIKAIAKTFKDDANASTEHERLEDQLIRQAETELNQALNELIPQENATSILNRYRTIGLKLPKDKDPFKTARKHRRKGLVEESSARVVEAIDATKQIESEEEWRAAEKTFLDCSYLLVTTRTRAHIDPELRNRFEQAGTTISHKRNGFEAINRIRKCIAEVNAALDKKNQRSNAATGTFAYSLADAVERLKSSELQARRLGNPITPELKAEIDETLKRAKGNKMPLVIFSSVVAVCLIAVGVYAMSFMNQRAAEQQAYDQAYSAVMDAQRSLLYSGAFSTLKKHEEAIDAADPTSDLAKQAKALETWTTQQKALESDFESIAERLEAQDLNTFDEQRIDETNRLLNGAIAARKSLASDLGDETQKRIDQFKSQVTQSAEEREEKVKRQIEIAVSQMERRVDSAVVADSKKDYLAQTEKAEKEIRQLDELISAYSQIAGVENNRAKIAAAQEALTLAETKWDALASTFKNLDSANDYETYMAELKRIQSFDILPQKEKAAITLVLKNQPTLLSLKQDMLMPNDLEGWQTFLTTPDYRKDKPSLNDVERVFLERLANDAFFETIYESKVKYFEGSTIARSEYTIYLYDPVTKVETGLKTGINYTFKVRGFDETGDVESEAREMNFLSHPDGSFWGFFYEPSSVSKESQYYEKTIRETLLKVLAGAPRFTVIDLVDQLSEARTLAPAFRAYWQQQLFTFMKMNPWKWGLPLSPSLQAQVGGLIEITQGDISKRQWLSSIEQTSPSFELSEYMRLAAKKDLAQEARAFATMYQFAIQGDYVLAGHISGNGLAKTKNSFENFEFLAANSLTGHYERIEKQNAPAPYSPLITFQFENKPSEHILQKTLFVTGTNLAEKEFAKYLPPLLEMNSKN